MIIIHANLDLGPWNFFGVEGEGEYEGVRLTILYHALMFIIIIILYQRIANSQNITENVSRHTCVRYS